LQQDLADVKAHAAASGAEGELLWWDVAFWAERLREAKYDLKDEELRPYFALPTVLEGLFKVCVRMYVCGGGAGVHGGSGCGGRAAAGALPTRQQAFKQHITIPSRLSLSRAQVAKRLFDVDIVNADGEVPVWHPDVRFFKVTQVSEMGSSPDDEREA
jgi:Zn-dependent oligopeptidase